MNELEEIHAMYDMTVAQFSGASDVGSGHFVVKNPASLFTEPIIIASVTILARKWLLGYSCMNVVVGYFGGVNVMACQHPNVIFR